MNHITLIGRLVKDPDLRYTPSGKAVCNFTLAVDRPFKGQDGKQEADFIPIQVWDKRAENCAKYLAKGKQAAVEGRLQIRSYEDNSGQCRWVTEVVANSVEFLTPSNTSKPADDMSDLGQEVTFDSSDVPF